jgi:hypothetical protein
VNFTASRVKIVEFTSSLKELGNEIASGTVCLGEEIAMSVSGGLRTDRTPLQGMFS